MSRLKQGLLATLDAVENGSAVGIAQLESVYVHVSGTFVGTWHVDVSFDGGTTWVQHATGTAAALTAILPPAGHMRGRCSAFTSGTITMYYGGRDEDRAD